MIKRVRNAVAAALVGLVVLLAALLWGFRLFGYEVLVVQSGSMEPAYHVGALVYVKPVDAAALQTGDVITFELGGGVRGTHRIVEIVEENGGLAFRTKGDSNEAPDTGLVLPDDIVGQVQFTVPYLGFLVTYMRQPSGIYGAVSVVAAIMLLLLLPDVLFSEPKKQEERK